MLVSNFAAGSYCLNMYNSEQSVVLEGRGRLKIVEMKIQTLLYQYGSMS